MISHGKKGKERRKIIFHRLVIGMKGAIVSNVHVTVIRIQGTKNYVKPNLDCNSSDHFIYEWTFISISMFHQGSEVQTVGADCLSKERPRQVFKRNSKCLSAK